MAVSPEIAVRITVRGRVQGVGFRDWVRETAARHDLRGWVRNRRDGSVEAVFAGAPDAVRSAVEACRSGPSGARVDHLAESPAAAEDAGPGFARRDTA